MSEPSGRELNDKIYEIREWLVRIDTKMDHINDIKRTAEEADNKAEKALNLAEENAKDIEGIKKTTHWAIGLIVPSVLTIVGILFTVVF